MNKNMEKQWNSNCIKDDWTITIMNVMKTENKEDKN
jgi:hypothetical protein